jgi:hypothetical protein
MLWQAGTRRRGSWNTGTPSKPNRKKREKKKITWTTVSLSFHDLPFSQNEPWKPADDYTLDGRKIKLKTYDVLDGINLLAPEFYI